MILVRAKTWQLQSSIYSLSTLSFFIYIYTDRCLCECIRVVGISDIWQSILKNHSCNNLMIENPAL